MARDYVEDRDGSFYLIGSRVPLARIVSEFQNGASPEAIRSSYSTLSLNEVYGAIHCCPRHWRRRRFPQHKHLIPPVSAAPPKGRLAGGRSVLSEATGHLTTTGGQETTPNGRFQAPKPLLTQKG